MGATLIQHGWKAVFEPLKSLDEPVFFALPVGAAPCSYVNFYWHGYCKRKAPIVMLTIIGTLFAS